MTRWDDVARLYLGHLDLLGPVIAARGHPSAVHTDQGRDFRTDSVFLFVVRSEICLEYDRRRYLAKESRIPRFFICFPADLCYRLRYWIFGGACLRWCDKSTRGHDISPLMTLAQSMRSAELRIRKYIINLLVRYLTCLTLKALKYFLCKPWGFLNLKSS